MFEWDISITILRFIHFNWIIVFFVLVALIILDDSKIWKNDNGGNHGGLRHCRSMTVSCHLRKRGLLWNYVVENIPIHVLEIIANVMFLVVGIWVNIISLGMGWASVRNAILMNHTPKQTATTLQGEVHKYSDLRMWYNVCENYEI